MADSQSVTTDEDTSKAITLVATDAEGDTLSYSVVTPPGHGTLSGAVPNLTYSPAANYNGSDTFTFKANDGKSDSNVATVTITVTAVNDAPVAGGQSVTTNEDTPRAITMVATDQEGDALTYSVVASPGHGTLTGTGATRTYTPAANYNGPDSFTFKANDGKADSNVATVTITVTAVNDAPVANAQSVTTAQNKALAVTLTGNDVEGSPLTYSLVTNPGHGTLGGVPPNLTYTPAAGYSGPDSFTFKVNDGNLDSAPATISITITASVNQAPIAGEQSVTTGEDTSKAITLTATDADGDPLTYIVVSSPAHGTLGGTAPNLTYTPAANYYGADGFTFKANDGKVDSIVATVTITVTPVNDAPVAADDAYSTNVNTILSIQAPGVLANDSDLESNPLTAVLGTAPSHGSLTLNPNGSFNYMPALNYSGPDSFTYYARDSVNSNVATVRITVVNSPPTVNAGQDRTLVLPNNILALSGAAGDDGLPNPPGTLTYRWTKVSGSGTVTFSSPTQLVTNAAFPAKTGSYTLRLTVSDGAISSSDDIVVSIRKR